MYVYKDLQYAPNTKKCGCVMFVRTLTRFFSQVYNIIIALWLQIFSTLVGLVVLRCTAELSGIDADPTARTAAEVGVQ